MSFVDLQQLANFMNLFQTVLPYLSRALRYGLACHHLKLLDEKVEAVHLASWIWQLHLSACLHLGGQLCNHIHILEVATAI